MVSHQLTISVRRDNISKMNPQCTFEEIMNRFWAKQEQDPRNQGTSRSWEGENWTNDYNQTSWTDYYSWNGYYFNEYAYNGVQNFYPQQPYQVQSWNGQWFSQSGQVYSGFWNGQATAQQQRQQCHQGELQCQQQIKFQEQLYREQQQKCRPRLQSSKPKPMTKAPSSRQNSGSNGGSTGKRKRSSDTIKQERRVVRKTPPHWEVLCVVDIPPEVVKGTVSQNKPRDILQEAMEQARIL